MSKHYSIESLRELAGGDADFMAVVAKTFLEEIPPDLKALVEAIENDNKELAYQFAHKMKPNLEMFGIDLQKEITSVESWTKTSKGRGTITEYVEKINTTLHIVFTEIKTDFKV